MAWAGTDCFIDNFNRAQTLSTTPGHNGWTIKDTSAAGTPTYLALTEDGGAVKLLMDNTSEEQIVTLYQNDVLHYDLDDLSNMWWVVKVGGIDAVTDVVMGCGAAQNDTEDSVVTNAWFKIDGSASTSALVAETDDGTNDNDDKATGTTLSTTYKRLLLDFSQGKSDVRFFVDGARVASGTTFDMSDLTSGLNVQPFIQLHKASGTGVGYVQVAQFGATFKWSYGS